MLKFSEIFELSQEKFRKIPILKEFQWFEWFEWFGPSPIEPFNSGQDALVADLRPVEVELSELRAAKDPREFEDRLVVDSGVVQVKDLCLPAASIYRTVELPFGKL